jgi:hypothetical protein
MSTVAVCVDAQSSTRQQAVTGQSGRLCLAGGRRGSAMFWQPPRGPNVYHTKLLESSPPPPLTSTLYTHNTAIRQDRSDLSIYSTQLQLYSAFDLLPLLSPSVITTNTQDGCHQAGACHQQNPPTQHLHPPCHVYMMKLNDSP